MNDEEEEGSDPNLLRLASCLELAFEEELQGDEPMKSSIEPSELQSLSPTVISRAEDGPPISCKLSPLYLKEFPMKPEAHPKALPGEDPPPPPPKKAVADPSPRRTKLVAAVVTVGVLLASVITWWALRR